MLSISLFVALLIYRVDGAIALGSGAHDGIGMVTYDIISPITTAIYIMCAVLLGTLRFRHDSSTEVEEYTGPHVCGCEQVHAYTHENIPVQTLDAQDTHGRRGELQQPRMQLHR